MFVFGVCSIDCLNLKLQVLQSYQSQKYLSMASVRAFWNSPVGPKTTHFWGPVANWGFVVAVCLFSLSFLLYN